MGQYPILNMLMNDIIGESISMYSINNTMITLILMNSLINRGEIIKLIIEKRMINNLLGTKPLVNI
jgi:ribonucleotide reductase beta subunit family protein with ferritin-like domain